MATLSKVDFLAVKPNRKVVEIEGYGSVTIEAHTINRRSKIAEIILTNLAEVQAYKADQELPEDQREGLPAVKPLDDLLVMVMFSMVDENGALLFSMDDYDAIGEVPYSVIERIYAEVSMLDTAKPSGPTYQAKKKPSGRRRN